MSAARLCRIVAVAVVTLSLTPNAGRAAAPREAPAPWSLSGHEIVCEIAFQRLDSAGRTLVFDVRRHDPEPSATFYQSCGWADRSRSTDHLGTYEYHFMNVVVPDAAGLEMQRDCAAYDCVQLAVVRYARYLSVDPGGNESQQVRRANALKFVAHFVGDLHQPLHVGYAHDRGGNDTYADFYGETRLRLHTIWDFHIPDRMGLSDDPVEAARLLNEEITAAETAAWESLDVVAWSRESYEVVKSLVYDFPPDGEIAEGYYERAAPIVRRRLKQAGVRLAYLINRVAAGKLQFPPLFDGTG